MVKFDFKRDLLHAKNVILKNDEQACVYKKYCRIPIKGTENVKELFKKMFDFNTILIVTGSGDQILEAILLGASRVQAFDINKLAKYGCVLKIASIKALEYDEFVDFYSSQFYNSYYKKIRKFLTGHYLRFWDILFQSFSPFQIFFSLFDSVNHDGEIIDNNFSIYSRNEYELIKKRIPHVSIHFIDLDLMHIKQEVNDSFDFIYLSNIYQYLSSTPKNFSEFIKQNLWCLLRNNGELIFNYYYGAAGELRKNFFPASAYSYMSSVKNECDAFNHYFDVQKYEVLPSGYGQSYFTKDLVLSLKK